MNATGGAIALGLAIAAGLLFGFYPELDIAIARWFSPGDGFPLQNDAALIFLRDASMWIVAALAAPAFLAVALKILRPDRRMLISGRAAVLLISTLALGPGLLANTILKEHSGRPRPREVVEFGGSARFVPWWDPRGTCRRNCSFIAGEASGAAWTFAPAALAPPAWRSLAYIGALTFTAAVGLNRIAFGGHFASDVIFAGVFVFLLVWCVHGLLFRWRTRIDDAVIEGALARIGFFLRRQPGRGPADDAKA